MLTSYDYMMIMIPLLALLASFLVVRLYCQYRELQEENDDLLRNNDFLRDELEKADDELDMMEDKMNKLFKPKIEVVDSVPPMKKKRGRPKLKK